MRRNTIILALMLMLSVVPAWAQSYPSELSGTQFPLTLSEDMLFYPTEYYNIPYSVPAPPENLAFLIDIFQPPSPPIPILRVNTECLFQTSTGECWLPIDRFETYPWDPDAGSYCNMSMVEEELYIDCFVFDMSLYAMKHYYGYLGYTGSPPQWWDWGYYFLDVAQVAPPVPPYHQQAPIATD